ncbi:hypothetical protein V1520DRAFT_365887 [Lipomyces starkeyi]
MVLHGFQNLTLPLVDPPTASDSRTPVPMVSRKGLRRILGQATHVECVFAVLVRPISGDVPEGINIPTDLPSDDRESLRRLLSQFSDVFAKSVPVPEVLARAVTHTKPLVPGAARNPPFNRLSQLDLRNLDDAQRSRWDEYLPLLEFAYNNSPQSTIGMTPFEADYGYHPKGLDRTSFGYVPAAASFSEELESLWIRSKGSMHEDQVRQKIYADRRRRQSPTFQVGDLVTFLCRIAALILQQVVTRAVPNIRFCEYYSSNIIEPTSMESAKLFVDNVHTFLSRVPAIIAQQATLAGCMQCLSTRKKALPPTPMKGSGIGWSVCAVPNKRACFKPSD